MSDHNDELAEGSSSLTEAPADPADAEANAQAPSSPPLPSARPVPPAQPGPPAETPPSLSPERPDADGSLDVPAPATVPPSPVPPVASTRDSTPDASGTPAAPAPQAPLSELRLDDLPVEEDEASVENVQATEEEQEDDDPFADWPQGESAEVIEDAPEEGTSVEHVAGEIDVPDGYSVLEGTPTGHRRTVAIVVARFNGGLTNRMLAKATETLEDAGVAPDAVTIAIVPGAFELPLAAMALAKTRRYACVVALGAIVRGETPHFDYIAAEAASGLQLAAIETGVPCAFGVLTVETVEQAEARIDRAAEAVRTALEMADVFAQLRASART
jgi:6,7-dimethyl-8-ribityllumazine synthase